MHWDGSNGSHLGPFGGEQAARSLVRGVSLLPLPPLFDALPFSLALGPSIEQLLIVVLPEEVSGTLTVRFPLLTFFAFVTGVALPAWRASTMTLPPELLTLTLIAPAFRICCCASLRTVSLPPPPPDFFLPSADPTTKATTATAATPATASTFRRVNDSIRFTLPLLSCGQSRSASRQRISWTTLLSTCQTSMNPKLPKITVVGRSREVI